MLTAEIMVKALLVLISLSVALAPAFGQSVSQEGPAYPVAGESRIALVIGNSDYKSSPLSNSVNDARDMAQRLKELGFDVIERENLSTRQIGPMLREFRAKLAPDSVALFFYAGHGLQVKGVNYFPAVDAQISGEDDVSLQSLDLSKILELFEQSKTRLNLVFLDACRNNPFARSFRSASNGLAKVEAPSGTLISFATRPGSVASDGEGRNGLYTEKLLLAMNESGQPIEATLKRVVGSVKAASKGAQEPWMEGSIEGDFYFKPPVSGQLNAAQGRNEFKAATSEEIEQDLWNSIKDANSWAALESYLAEYPKGRFVMPARILVAKLHANATPAAASVASGVPKDPLIADGQILKDCAHCPELVAIPAGTFMMGSTEAEQQLAQQFGVHSEVTSWESPFHKVGVRGFLAGKFAVTKGEFATFVKATGYVTEAEKGTLLGCTHTINGAPRNVSNTSWRNPPGIMQFDDHPVVCVTWYDAQTYIDWLSKQASRPYRLLTEAEREYVTRADTESIFWTGSVLETKEANFNGREGFNGARRGGFNGRTVPVDSFGANPFGLYNVHGNVWEWVQDIFHLDYNNAPTDGAAWLSGGQGSKRVLRGGSWADSATSLRSASRMQNTAIVRNNNYGFRVARDINF